MRVLNRAGRQYRVTIDGRELCFETQPGIFSANEPDPGTRLLLSALLPELKAHQKLLDLGTGVGLIGVALAGRLSGGEVWMSDVDIRCTRLAERNLSNNRVENGHVVLSDGTRDLPPRLRFDLVASNPPTHDGHEVLMQLVGESYSVLRPGGSLWIVVNRLLSIRSMMQDAFDNVEQISRRKGSVVFRSVKRRSPKPVKEDISVWE